VAHHRSTSSQLGRPGDFDATSTTIALNRSTSRRTCRKRRSTTPSALLGGDRAAPARHLRLDRLHPTSCAASAFVASAGAARPPPPRLLPRRPPPAPGTSGPGRLARPGFPAGRPAAWVGSDYLRFFLDLFAYERAGTTLVIGAGLPARGSIPRGVGIENLQTTRDAGLLAEEERGVVRLQLWGTGRKSRRRVRLASV
jgi:hypothetical protein